MTGTGTASAEGFESVYANPALLPYVADLKWLAGVRNAARVRYHDHRLDLSGYRAKVRALIEAHVRSDGVRTVLEPVSILAPEFDEELARLPGQRARASLIEHALRHEIELKLNQDPAYYRSLYDRDWLHRDAPPSDGGCGKTG